MSPPENLNEASIPLLTEVIEPPAATKPVARTSAPVAATAPDASTPIAHVQPATPAAPAAAAPPVHPLPSSPAAPLQALAQTPAQPALHLSEHDWEQLQSKLSERVLRQLQGRIDFVLEQRIRDSLADVLQLAMVGLTSEIKRGLQHTLEEVIGRAVAQEIARLQNQKK
ncbi:MAG: hypothetical protein RL748_1956 [Pseudomonadota bacterium]|jgi:hypothetical protein